MTSPLIVLFKSRQSELLPQLFREIVVPPAVWREITQTKRQDEAAINLPKTPWINRVQEVAIAPEVAAKNLGIGWGDRFYVGSVARRPSPAVSYSGITLYIAKKLR